MTTDADRRDREIERTGHRKIQTPFTVKAVGISFVDSYPDNLYALDEAWTQAEHREESMPVVLVRNPDNEYDANAIEVHVPSLGDEWGMIGHLTRPIAARMAPEMDAGGQFQAEVVSVLIDPDHLDRPGISISVDRVPEEEA